MTQHDAERYADALKHYEEELKHIYLFPNGDKTFRDFFKGITFKGIITGIVAFGIFILLFGAIMGIVSADMTKGFKGALGIIGIPLLASLPYSYLFYVNDIKNDGADAIYPGVGNIILWAIASVVFHVENIAILIAIYIVATYIIMRFEKNINYSIPKPTAYEFDSERPIIDTETWEIKK